MNKNNLRSEEKLLSKNRMSGVHSFLKLCYTREIKRVSKRYLHEANAGQ